MKRIQSSIVCAVALLIAWSQASSQTPVSTDVTVNTTWTTAGSPYNLSTDISVTGGVTLTIQAGVVVNLKSNAGLTISGSSKLVGSSVTFAISGIGVAQVLFSNTSSGTISNSFFNRVSVRCDGPSSPAITNNSFTDAGYPIWLNDGASPTLSGNTFAGTTTQGIRLAGATYRSWVIPNYTLPYFVDGDSYLNVDNAKLTIADGNTVNFVGSNSISVNRTGDTLMANNVTFTRIGTGTPSVSFAGTNPRGTISNCTFNGVYVDIEGGAPTVSTNTFSGANITTAIDMSGIGSAAITNNTISGVKYPYRINDGATPTFSGNTISGATNQGIKLYGAIYQSWTIPNYGLPYFVDGDVYLNVDNAKLTIADGNTVNFVGSYSLSVNRTGDTLMANNVTFTRIGTGTPSVSFAGTKPRGTISNCIFNGVYVDIEGGSPTVSANTFNGANISTAIDMSGIGSAVIMNNTISAVKYPYRINDGAAPTFSGNNIAGATNQGIKLYGAIYQSWTIPNYGLPYFVDGDAYLNVDNAKLTIADGNTVNFVGSYSISVNRTGDTLMANNVTFTRIGTGTPSVSFAGTKPRGTISNCVFNGVYVDIEGGAPTVSTNTFNGANITTAIDMSGVGSALITNNTISGVKYPYRINDGATPIFTGNNISGATNQGIKLYGAIYESWIIPNYGLPYFVDGDAYLNVDNAKLTIADGNTVNFVGSYSISVNRTGDTLMANNVTFTRIGTGSPYVSFSGTIPKGTISNCVFNGVYVDIEGGSPTVSTNTFNGANITTAIDMSGTGSAAITNNTISAVKYPYRINDGATPTFSGNNIASATNQGIRLYGAIYQSWTIPNYGMPYFVDGDVYVNADNAKLTIAIGNTLNMVGSYSVSTSRNGDTLAATDVAFTRMGSGSPSIVFNNDSKGLLRSCFLNNVQVQCNGTSKDSIIANNFVGATDCIVRNNTSSLILSANNFLVATTNYGVKNLNPSSVVVARGNYWGHASGPQHSSNPSGQGVKVTDGVDFAGWATATEVRKDEGIPKVFALYQNYPNPFNPSTIVSFDVPQNSHVVLKIYDLAGREILTLVNEERKAGRYDVRVDGHKLASGVYYYRLSAGDYVMTKAMMLMK